MGSRSLDILYSNTIDLQESVKNMLRRGVDDFRRPHIVLSSTMSAIYDVYDEAVAMLTESRVDIIEENKELIEASEELCYHASCLLYTPWFSVKHEVTEILPV